MRRLSVVGLTFLPLTGIWIAPPSAAQAVSLTTFQPASGLLADVTTVPEAKPSEEAAKLKEKAAKKAAKEAKKLAKAEEKKTKEAAKAEAKKAKEVAKAEEKQAKEVEKAESEKAEATIGSAS